MRRACSRTARGFELCYAQGAGAYLGGTTTAAPRKGNFPEGLAHPFVPYPRSKASSNCLGLPNKGHAFVAEKLSRQDRKSGFPIGASLAALPGEDGARAGELLIEGMSRYEDAGVDFIEINESCPNTGEELLEGEGLAQRLQFVSEKFLQKRSRTLPVILKFSPDMNAERLEDLIPLLFRFGFDGVNFGNTSTCYSEIEDEICPREQELFRFFTTHFGGGIGGLPLRAPSLELVRKASRIVKEQGDASKEFHIIQTGGVHCGEDVADSLAAGASLCGWYTGYFSAFASQGHDLYQTLYKDLDRRLSQ